MKFNCLSIKLQAARRTHLSNILQSGCQKHLYKCCLARCDVSLWLAVRSSMSTLGAPENLFVQILVKSFFKMRHQSVMSPYHIRWCRRIQSRQLEAQIPYNLSLFGMQNNFPCSQWQMHYFLLWYHFYWETLCHIWLSSLIEESLIVTGLVQFDKQGLIMGSNNYPRDMAFHLSPTIFI